MLESCVWCNVTQQYTPPYFIGYTIRLRSLVAPLLQAAWDFQANRAIFWKTKNNSVYTIWGNQPLAYLYIPA